MKPMFAFCSLLFWATTGIGQTIPEESPCLGAANRQWALALKAAEDRLQRDADACGEGLDSAVDRCFLIASRRYQMAEMEARAQYAAAVAACGTVL
jgi:hypothetical protein